MSHFLGLSSLGSLLPRLVFAALLAASSFVVGITAVAAEAVMCGGMVATIMGTAGPDVLQGTPGPDVIAGLGGNDIINGAGGDDLVCGGNGADTLRGGLGNDTIYGQKGNDELRGDAGKDILRGGNGADVARGGKGNDTVEGGRHQDHLEGNIGRDTLRGQGGVDELRGAGGNDRLFGGGSADELVGGDGADFCRGGPGFATLAACETFGATPADVSIAQFAFAPETVNVTPGTTVRWINQDGPDHTTTQDTQDPANRSWDSGPLSTGDSFAVTFDIGGSYSYFCSIHPFMQAIVNVAS